MSNARFTKGLILAAAASGASLCQLLPPGSSTPLAVHEISLTLMAATASTIAIVESATLGTAGASVNAISESGLHTLSTSTIVTAWSANPTLSANGYILEQYLPGIQGANVTFSWDARSPLIVSPGYSLLIYNAGAGASSQMSANITFSEEARACGERFTYSNLPGVQ